jgi:hypothetical protein
MKNEWNFIQRKSGESATYYPQDALRKSCGSGGSWNAGTYLYRIIQNNELLQQGKLVIIK